AQRPRREYSIPARRLIPGQTLQFFDPGQCAAHEVPGPDIVFLIADIQGRTSPVGRNTNIKISSCWYAERFLMALPVYPNERATQLCAFTRHVSQSAAREMPNQAVFQL